MNIERVMHANPVEEGKEKGPPAYEGTRNATTHNVNLAGTAGPIPGGVADRYPRRSPKDSSGKRVT